MIKTRTLMKTIKVKSCGKFLVGKHIFEDNTNVTNNPIEEQVMNARGKSGVLPAMDYVGHISERLFTIKDVVKDNDGEYIYTIECDTFIPAEWFPTVYEIVPPNDDIAAAVNHTVIKK